MAEHADAHVTGDRRPIASRKMRIWQVTAETLARWGMSANLISLMGMIFGMAGGACLLGTHWVEGLGARLLLLAAAACIQLRLLANMLDGMVAIASGKASLVGELFNELPDRISDTAILVGAGYAVGGHPTLGWAAAAMALFVTYIRAVGKSVGVPGLFHGPMSKSHRMFAMTVTCLYLGAAPASWQLLWKASWASEPLGIMSAVLALIIIGGMVTAFRRLVRIVHALKERV
jgi:phosphatidylglycerophosphate synthase